MDILKKQFKKFINQLINGFYFIISLLLIGGIVVYASNIFPTKVNTGETLTESTINSIIDYLVPVGAIVPFNSLSCPTGWTKADGQNGTPDLRGEFIRGLDDGKGIDSARVLGSWQEDMFKEHSHGLDYTHRYPNSGVQRVIAHRIGNYSSPSNSVFSNIKISNTGGSETRPRNVALLYCVKQ